MWTGRGGMTRQGRASLHWMAFEVSSNPKIIRLQILLKTMRIRKEKRELGDKRGLAERL